MVCRTPQRRHRRTPARKIMNEPQNPESAETAKTTSVPAVDLPRLVLCFCVPAPHPIQRGDVLAYACNTEGKTLSSHYCSSEWWAQQDIMGESHHKDYPEGFVLKWVGTPPANWDGFAENDPEMP